MTGTTRPTVYTNPLANMLRTLKAHRGRTVTYQRGDLAATLTAIPGQTDATLDSGESVAVEITLHDWLVDPADLELDGQAIEPEPGDLIITEEPDSHSYTYTVIAAMPGEPPWRWSDDSHTRIRIHTTLTDRET